MPIDVITRAPSAEPFAVLARRRVFLLQPEPGDEPEPAWFADALQTFRKHVGHPEYPCHFGRAALEQRELFVTYIEDDVRPLATALAAFLDYAAPTPRRRQVLAAFFPPDLEEHCHQDHDRRFWSVLQFLHDYDERPWPRDIPRSPESSQWEFSFHGTAMFVFAAAPTHRRRLSRNLGDSEILLFQPRNVFLGIEGGTRAGTAARRRIRERLARWDKTDLHPAMGDYGDPSNFEWRQYFIADDNSELHTACPLHLGPHG